MQVAVVAIAKNEAAFIKPFLHAIEQQTRKPDLFVLVVAPGTDETEEYLEEWTSDLNGLVIITKGNRSEARNIGIRRAIEEGAEIIALTNVCVPTKEWLERLVAPAQARLADVVGGSWMFDVDDEREYAMALLTQYSSGQMDATKISALNMAVHRDVFSRVGFFNEELETSEDTEFVKRLLFYDVDIALEPEAYVWWRPATLTMEVAVKTYYQFAKTDGQAFLNFPETYAPIYLVAFTFGILTFVAPLLALGLLGSWLLFRIRKVLHPRLFTQIPYAVISAAAMDVARMVGFVVGRVKYARCVPAA